jgi:hypothetical protein
MTASPDDSISIPVIAIMVTVALAFIGYFVTFFSNRLLAKRREALDLIDAQISQFYGPLFIIATVGRIEYLALINKVGRTSEGELERPLAPAEFQEWRIWMTEVFMPMNEWCEKLLLGHAYLLREERLPDCIIDFFTHVAGYKPVLKKWADGDFSEQFSIIDFPTGLQDYAAKAYRELKAEQLRLIGLTKAG